MLRHLFVCMLTTASLAQAQPTEPVKRTPLQKAALPGDRLVAIQALVEVAPNAMVERHSHHGVEMVYVLEGFKQFARNLLKLVQSYAL